MQPDNHTNQSPSIESAPLPKVNPEAIPSLPPLKSDLERHQDRFEQAAETGAIKSDLAGSAADASQVAQPIQAIPSDDSANITSSTSTPMVAADEDVIEKEWVDRSKKIVNDTKGDPYKRSEEVHQLKDDYQEKRFGRNAKA